jgi:pimeloyl-ACP methyl ester carboxylesterase
MLGSGFEKEVNMVMFFRILRWGATILAGLFLLIFVSLLTYRVYLERMTRIDTVNGISSLEEITLGNIKQWIFIRGTDQNNPVLIFLHGGPGVPFLGMPSSRTEDAELIKHFTVVHWDQRGAGKSYSKDTPVESMTFDRLVEDCNELIDYVRDRFNARKVFIVAHSGGTIIGIKTAYKYPEKIHAYVGVAQIINDLEHQKISYRFIVDEAKKTGNVRIVKAIEAIGPPPFDSLDKFNKKDGYVSRFGGIYHGKDSIPMWVLGLSFLTSPEYSLFEGFETFSMRGFDFTMNAMYEEYKSINLSEEIGSMKVPVFFFEGKFDWAIPLEPVKIFFDSLEVENGKHFIVFEYSGHFPMVEEKEKYEELLIALVLNESHDNK